MKNIIYLITVGILLLGCTNNSNISEQIVTQEPVIEKGSTLKEVAQYYLNSKLILDIDKSSVYMDPISWEVLKLKLHEQDTNIIKQQIKEAYITTGIKQMNEKLNMKMVFGNVFDSVSSGNNNMYLFSYFRTGENKYDKIYEKNVAIAITDNMGKSWRFIGIDSDFLSETKQFFTRIYPSDVSDRVFESISNELNSKQEVLEFIATNDIEKKLERDFIAFSNACNNGSPDIAISYMYNDVFNYLQNSMPEENYSIDEIKESIKESMFAKMKGQLTDKETIISKILNKVEYDNSLIYVISYALKKRRQNNELSIGGETIAVSTDNGNNWTFFEKDDESVIPVLSIKYPNSVVSKVLNYEYKK